MEAYLNQSKLSIETDVTTEQFGKLGSFNVTVSCSPAFVGTDKELMNFVCNVLTSQTEGIVIIKTRYVVLDASFETTNNKMAKIRRLVFQVLTPNSTLW